MRHLLSIIVVIALSIGVAMAQPRAVGVRIGYNLEASYQHATSSGMLEVDAGVSPFISQKGIRFDEYGTPVEMTYHYGRVQAVLCYNWLRNIKNNWNWYFGVGVGVSWGYGDFFELPRYNKRGNLVTFSRLGLPVGVQVGMEYDFGIPLNLSLDWRPMINLFGLRQGDFTSNLFNFAIGVRYRL